MNTTTLEQSKKLKEWGAPQDTSFHWMLNIDKSGKQSTPEHLLVFNKEHPKNWKFNPTIDYAAYSLEELIVWLGDDFTDVTRSRDGETTWFTAFSDTHGSREGDTLLEAVFNLAQAIHNKES